MPARRTSLLAILLLMSSHVMAWWNGPQTQPYVQPYGYSWPNVWPGYGRGYAPHVPAYGSTPYGYNGSDWNMKGYMNEQGDMHFIMEYHGNIYNDMFGGNYVYPGYRGYGAPYYGGWR